MAYIGQKPLQEFSSIPTKDTFTGDGSTTTFDLANDVVRGGENSLEVFVNNVRQEPGTGKAFVLGIDGSSNYRRITFSSAPANGAAIYVINDKTNLTTIAPVQTDFNGVEIVLDADSDTTLHAETDDQVDLRIAGVDVLKFLQSSGDAVLKPMVDAKDIIFQQFDGNKIFEINDGNFVGVGGNATAPGEIRIFEDSDNGTNYSGFKAAASTTSSVAYQLPAADGSSGTQLTTDGSGVLSWSAGITIANDANNRITTATGSSGLNGEASLTFDGTTLAVTGNQTVSGTLGVTGVLTGTSLDISGDIDIDGTSNLDVVDIDGAVDMASTLGVAGVVTANAGVVVDNITIDGTEIDLSSGDLTVDVAGDIILDAGGADIILKDDGTQFGKITNGSTNISIFSGTTLNTTMDGANITFAGTIDSGAITSTGIVTGTAFTAGSAVLAEAELELLDGLTAGTAIASKVVTTDANIDTTGQRNLTITGELDAATGDFSGAVDIAGATTTAAITASGILKTDDTTEATSTTDGSLQTDGGLSVAKDIVAGDDIKLLSDAGVIHFGTNSEVTLTHSHDAGLLLKHTATADDKPINLVLQTGETDMAANDVIGKISWQAPDEGTGTDAILVSAAIQAVAEGDHSASSNATSLQFLTGASEAATAKIKITSAGHLFPMADDTYDLGGSSNQWRNIYTGDLHLSNMTKEEGNVVDGTKGDWTIQEGADELYLMNNNSGKKYKFNLTEV